MSLNVKDVMIRQVLTIEAAQNAKNAARLMTKFGVSNLIVSDQDDIVSILSLTDITRLQPRLIVDMKTLINQTTTGQPDLEFYIR